MKNKSSFKYLIQILILTIFCANNLFGETFEIVSGPMSLSTQMRQANIWFELKDNQNSAIEKENMPVAFLKQKNKYVEIKKLHSNAYIATVDDVEPNTKYDLIIAKNKDDINSQNAISFNFKTSPDFENKMPPPDFKIAVLSNLWDNQKLYDDAFKEEGGEFEILQKLANLKPELVLWAGSAINLRPADQTSLSGYLKRYAHHRSSPYSQELFKTGNHIAIMGKDAYSKKYTDKFSPTKDFANEAFNNFFIMPNKPDKNSNFAVFSYADVDIFLLDSLSQRDIYTKSKSQKSIFGNKQLEYLLSALRSSKANFKIIVSDIAMMNPNDEDYNWNLAKKEKDNFLEQIKIEKIENLLFVCQADKFAEVTKNIRQGAYELYEFEVGPTTNRPSNDEIGLNYFRVPSSKLDQRNFAVLFIQGEDLKRTLNLTYYNSKGENIFELKINQEDLNKFTN